MTSRHGKAGGVLRLNHQRWRFGTSIGTPTPTPTPAPTPTPTPTPSPTPPNTSDAVWFDIQPAAGTVAPDAAVQVVLTPRLGKWPASGTISLASNKAGAFGTFSVPTGTATPIITNYTPAALGYHLITATNTLGIKNPGYVGLSVITASNGAALTISQTTAQAAVIKDASIWERDSRGGAMGSGWSAGFTKGWARLDVPLTLSGSASALWMRLYQADTAAAINSTNAATPGTGTLLQAPVQVARTLPSGASTVSVNIPAGMNYYYVEFATDQAFTNPYRIPKRLGAGHRICMSSRSYLCVLTWGWDYFGFSGLPNYLTMAGNYGLASSYTALPQGATNDWRLHDGVPASDTSPGVMEICRLMSGATGVLTGIIGSAIQGGSLDNHLTTLGQLSTLGLVSVATNGLTKFSYFIFAERDTTMSDEQLGREYGAITDWLQTLSGCPIINSHTLIDNYHTGNQMSVLGNGYGRAQSVAVALEKTRRDIVSASPMPGTLVHSHSGMLDRVVTGRNIARALLSREDPAFGGTGGPNGTPQGPRFALSGGSRLPGSYVLTIPIEHRGGFSVVPIRATFTNDTPPITIATPSSIELATLFTVRLRGEYFGYGRRAVSKTFTWESVFGVCVRMDATTPITVVNTSPGVSKIQIKLDSSVPGSITFVDGSSMPFSDAQAFAVSYATDIPSGVIVPGQTTTAAPYSGTPGYIFNGTSYWLADDHNPEGVHGGHDMQREIIYYVEAPVPAAQSVAMNTPPSTLPSGWLELKGAPGTGPRVSDLQFAVDGGAKASPVWSALYDDNSWSAVLRAPSAIGTHTVAAYRTGQSTPDVTKSFGVQPAATLLGAGSDAAYMNLSSAATASYIESYSAQNQAGQWTDTAGTQSISGELNTILRWDGDSGNAANRMGLYHYQSDLGYPAIDFNAIATNIVTQTSSVSGPDKVSQHLGVQFEFGQALFGTCTPIISKMTGDFTVVGAHRTAAFNSNYAPWTLVDSGKNYIVGVYDNGLATFFRDANRPTAPFTFGVDSLSAYVMRYRVSDGLIEVFYAPPTGGSWATISRAAAPGTLALAGLQMTPYFGALFSLVFFNSRFGGDLSTGDVNAALTHLTNRWG